MSSSFSRAAVALLAFMLLVVAWGGLVRASRSGDGCGANWPSCNGELLPTHPALKTRVEFTHRLMSGTSLGLILGLGVWAFRRFPKKSWPRRGAAAAVALILLEALIGAAIVRLRLVGADSSLTRVVGMGLHLVSTFFLLAALLLTALWAAGTPPPVTRAQGPLGTLLFASLAALLLLGVSGAMAALGDTLFPVQTLKEGLAQDASPGAHFLLRLRGFHPLLAGASACLLLATAAVTSALRPSPRVRRMARLLSLLLLTQLLVGLLNLALLAPLPLQLVHLVLADAVWLALVALAAVALAEGTPELQLKAPAEARPL